MLELADAKVEFCLQPLIQPLHLSSGVIRSASQVTATVTIEIGGRRTTGRGTVYLSDLWAWPDLAVPHHMRDQVLRRFCEQLATDLPVHFRDERMHPLEAGLRLHELACSMVSPAPDPPALARIMCASPFDAAIHDAAGRAVGRSAFALYEDDSPIPSADTYFTSGNTCRAIRSMLQPPRTTLPAWYIVSHYDDCEGLLRPAIQKHGYRCFKLKLTGRDKNEDVDRTTRVYRAAIAAGVHHPQITVDANEGNPSAESVGAYLQQLQAIDADAYRSLQYLEQPTSRDILRHPFDWRAVVQFKPVLLDEGLTGLSLMGEAQRQGYSGFALKTCKGHSMLLVCAAWARQQGMCISLQDLTNPGIALIHAALVGSRLPTINGAELNSPQFTPAANSEFLPRLSTLFEPRDGIHRLPAVIPTGLGSHH